MAHFLRGKQAGIQRDFSAGIDPAQFAVDTVRKLSLLTFLLLLSVNEARSIV